MPVRKDFIEFRLPRNKLGLGMRKIVKPPSLEEKLMSHRVISHIMLEYDFGEISAKVVCDLLFLDSGFA